MSNSKEITKLEQFKHCFCDFTSGVELLLPNLPFELLYLKIKHDDAMSLLTKTFHSEIHEITLEITNINLNSKVNINEVIKNINVKRVVLNLPMANKEQLLNYKEGLFPFINQVDIDNLCVDFYFRYEETNATKEITEILNHYTQIKHFSIYFDNPIHKGMMVPPRIGDFRRYHQHMWAKDNYHSSFQLTSVIEKSYLGIGLNAMSRHGNEIYKCEIESDKKTWKLVKATNFPKMFIVYNDHIDRFAFYYQLPPEEIKKHPLISLYDYEKALEQYQNDIYSVHEYFIARFVEKIPD